MERADLPEVVGSEDGGTLSGKGARQAASWKTLVNKPGSFIDMSGRPQPISLLASQLVVDHPGAWDTAPWTERYWNVRRKNILAYKARKFHETKAWPSHLWGCFLPSHFSCSFQYVAVRFYLAGLDIVGTMLEPSAELCVTVVSFRCAQTSLVNITDRPRDRPNNLFQNRSIDPPTARPIDRLRDPRTHGR